MPKCEIFDGSDFHDFYTIKVCMGEGATLGLKLVFFLLLGALFEAAKFLTRMLSLIKGGFF